MPTVSVSQKHNFLYINQTHLQISHMTLFYGSIILHSLQNLQRSQGFPTECHCVRHH